MPTSDSDRRALATVRGHLKKAFDAVPQKGRSVSHMRPILACFISSINDEIGTVEDDAAAGWPTADHWHDGPAPVRRPAYVPCPKVDGEPDERTLGRDPQDEWGWPPKDGAEGAEVGPRHSRGDC